MAFRKTLILGLFLFMAVYARAEDGNKQTEADEHDKNVISQSTGHPRMNVGDFSLPSGLSTFLANGGIIAGVVLALGALVILVSPLFGVRLCNYFGNCDAANYQGYSAGPGYDYQGYQQGTYNNPVYQKRSLEYIGPILKALGNAYDKYNRQMSAASAATSSAKSA